MSADLIAEVLERDPFEPFRLHTSDGRSYDVRNPHMVALMKSKVFVALPDSERWAFVSSLHISAIETLNGHAGRRRRPRG